jgi:uncharacterized protein YkwD
VGAEARLLILFAGVLVSLLAIASPGAAIVRKQPSLAAGRSLETGLLGKINALRAGRGLARLRLHARLGAAALEHSRQMARRGFFSHRSPDGSTFGQRVQRYYGAAGYRYWSAGENLMWSSGPLDPSAVVDGWLKSPGHRKVLLDASWRELGIAALQVAAAPGVYGGMGVTIVTADFGVRR